MITRNISATLKAITRRVFLLLAGGLIVFGLSHPAVLAVPQLGAESGISPTLALAGSSRFAAQAEAGSPESAISEDKLNEMREKRREWQSEASGEAAQEAQEEANDSFGEALREKLNLEEISEENEIIETIKD